MLELSKGKALVMGASGFLGSHVVKALAAEGRDIRIFTRATSDISPIEGLNFEHVIGELSDVDLLRKATQGCSAIYYCIVDTRAWLKDPAPLRVTNVFGLRNVLDVAMEVGVERFIFTSTFMTLGLNPSGVATEADTFNWHDEASEYVLVRVEAEKLFLDYCKRGLPGIVCNVSMTYGAEDRQPTPHGWVIQLVMRGLMPAWDGAFSSVGILDAASAMLLAEKFGRVGERYLITDKTLPLKVIWKTALKAADTHFPVLTAPMWFMYLICWLAENLCWLFGRDTEITIKSLRLTRIVKDFDNSKARKELHWNPRPVEESIAAGARWFRENKTRR